MIVSDFESSKAMGRVDSIVYPAGTRAILFVYSFYVGILFLCITFPFIHTFSSSLCSFWMTVDAWVMVPTRFRQQKKRGFSSNYRYVSSILHDAVNDTAQCESFDIESDRQHHCSVCMEKFSSRNALFRHLRNGHAGSDTGVDRNLDLKALVKYTVAVSVGYFTKNETTSYSISQYAGLQVQMAIRYAFWRLQNSSSLLESASHRFAIVSQTQASVAKSRPECLSQEDQCASAEDIMIVKIVVPTDLLSIPLQSDPIRHFNKVPPVGFSPYTHLRQSRKNCLLRHLGNCIPEFLALSNQGLDAYKSALSTSAKLVATNMTTINVTSQNVIVQMHGIRILDDDDDDDESHHVPIPTLCETEANTSPLAPLYPPSYKKVHAEQSCTQHVYHGLIPVTWLPNHTDIVNWYRTSYHEPVRHLRAPIPNTIRLLKQILRAMESLEQVRTSSYHDLDRVNTTMETDSSPELITATQDDRIAKSAAAKGRYGALAYRIPRYWHNYADPSLRISPNYDPAYRVIDRSRIVDFVWINGTHNDDAPTDDDVGMLYIVCSVMGDEFLRQQVRRMLGAAVAMINEWLPMHHFLHQSIDPAVIIETPIVPSTLVYRACSRFHWNEMDGQRLFPYGNDVKQDRKANENVFISATEDPINWIHTHFSFSQRLSKNDLESSLFHLRDVVCPRIRKQIYTRFQKPQQVWQPNTVFQLPAPPDAYRAVLNILRNIMSNHLWPSTSVARSSVIASSQSPNNHSSQGEMVRRTASTLAPPGGSFTVINTRVLNEINDHANFPTPKANMLFPELTKAVFELEEWIIEHDAASTTAFQHDGFSSTEAIKGKKRRSPSTHCAVNCNAQFLPHVDSGRGLGQSTSMIVGLGDYVGGEIAVEQMDYPIRYQPLEFDGWNLRHWTNPFAGPDRFSLVWFTPATSSVRDE